MPSRRCGSSCGAVAGFGVYTFVEGGFAFDEMLDNAATACLVLLFITPLTVGVMLYLWQRSGAGTVAQLKEPLLRSLKLLLLFIGSALGTVLIFQLGGSLGMLGTMLVSVVGLWMAFFVIMRRLPDLWELLRHRRRAPLSAAAAGRGDDMAHGHSRSRHR